jgi:hypothetical protein
MELTGLTWDSPSTFCTNVPFQSPSTSFYHYGLGVPTLNPEGPSFNNACFSWQRILGRYSILGRNDGFFISLL